MIIKNEISRSRRLAFFIRFLFVIVLAFGLSCSKDSIPLEFKEISSLEEAQAAFERISLSDIQLHGAHAEWRKLAKGIRWDGATWTEKNGGVELLIPVDLPGTFSVYYPVDSTRGAPIKTRLWVRRLGDGSWDFKLLTNLPDHLQSQEAGFSGVVLAEDWLTGQITYAVYEHGRVLSKLEWMSRNLQMGMEYQCHDKYVIGCVNDVCRPYYVGQECDWYYVGENETFPPPDEGGIDGGGRGGGGGGSSNSNNATMSDQDMEDIADQLIDPVTGDPIELYLVLKMNNPNKLKLSTSSQGDPIEIGDYILVPHKNSQGQIVYYAASRQGSNGIEYIVDAQGLSSFQSKIDLYTAAANLFYQGGIPTNSMIQLAAGNTLNSRIEGLSTMWGEALTSAEWWAYTATAYLHGLTNLFPNTVPMVVGHTTPWSAMTNAEQNALKHSYTRHRVELGLPDWTESNAIQLQSLFNISVSKIRHAGLNGFFQTQHRVNGVMTTVNRTEPVINGQKYYYYETLQGKFVSAGKM